MPTVKIGASHQVVIPKKLYTQLKIAPGDYLEVELEDHRLIMTPKILVEKRLAEGLKDIKEGRVRGPFKSTKEAMKALRSKKQ